MSDAESVSDKSQKMQNDALKQVRAAPGKATLKKAVEEPKTPQKSSSKPCLEVVLSHVKKALKALDDKEIGAYRERSRGV